MLLSFLLFAACAVTATGVVSVLLPLRFLGIRNRFSAIGITIAGIVASSVVLSWPAPEQTVVSRRTAIDEYAPVYQFSEFHSIPVHASADRVFDALMGVSADEIPFYKELAWFRRGGITGPANILNPPDGVPLLAVATRTSFVTLASHRGREFAMGTVVLAPAGVRLAVAATPESFKALTVPGFAKATMSFTIEPLRDGWQRLNTETRVYATDTESREIFARYWRVITPGSAFVRKMWLRAIKVRAESGVTSLPSPPARPRSLS
jgi:hypothetical protein